MSDERTRHEHVLARIARGERIEAQDEMSATYRDSPAEPERTTVVLALARSEIVSLTLRAAERPDVQAELERVVQSFALVSRESPQ